MFAALLVYGLDLICFDAFAQAHRVHASTVGITKLLPTYAGFLLEKEIQILSQIVKKPKRPLVAILGGAKISDKIGALAELVKIADQVLIGGGLANVFLKALGVPMTVRGAPTTMSTQPSRFVSPGPAIDWPNEPLGVR